MCLISYEYFPTLPDTSFGPTKNEQKRTAGLDRAAYLQALGQAASKGSKALDLGAVRGFSGGGNATNKGHAALAKARHMIEIAAVVIAVATIYIGIYVKRIVKLLEENREREQAAKRVRELERL